MPKICLQYCATVLHANFDKFPGFSWLFEEMIFQGNFSAFFEQ